MLMIGNTGEAIVPQIVGDNLRHALEVSVLPDSAQGTRGRDVWQFRVEFPYIEIEVEWGGVAPMPHGECHVHQVFRQLAKVVAASRGDPEAWQSHRRKRKLADAQVAIAMHMGKSPPVLPFQGAEARIDAGIVGKSLFGEHAQRPQVAGADVALRNAIAEDALTERLFENDLTAANVFAETLLVVALNGLALVAFARDLVSSLCNLADKSGIALGDPRQNKECRLHAELVQEGQGQLGVLAHMGIHSFAVPLGNEEVERGGVKVVFHGHGQDVGTLQRRGGDFRLQVRLAGHGSPSSGTGLGKSGFLVRKFPLSCSLRACSPMGQISKRDAMSFR